MAGSLEKLLKFLVEPLPNSCLCISKLLRTVFRNMLGVLCKPKRVLRG